MQSVPINYATCPVHSVMAKEDKQNPQNNAKHKGNLYYIGRVQKYRNKTAIFYFSVFEI